MGKWVLSIAIIMTCVNLPFASAEDTMESLGAQMRAVMQDQANQMDRLRESFEQGKITQEEYEKQVAENSRTFQEQTKSLEQRFHEVALESVKKIEPPVEDPRDGVATVQEEHLDAKPMPAV